MNLKDLKRYTVADEAKLRLIAELSEPVVEMDMCLEDRAPLYKEDSLPLKKYCPKCGREYPESENFCFDCLVGLKDIRHVDARDIEIDPAFEVEKTDDSDGFEEIFSRQNMDKMDEFDFNVNDLDAIIKDIKLKALKTFDKAIKDNDIAMQYISVLDKITLFAKSFAGVEYKSYGAELGYMEFGKICIDERQCDALQITTLLHELTHLLIIEIVSEIICRILDCPKTSEIKSVSVFILSYSPLNRLMDEYAAHTVEGRFTLFGYQDYSSYLSIEKTIDLPREEIEMIKTIGNSFANIIKDILESFIDRNLLEDIKDQFRSDIMDEPDYTNLSYENCTLLNKSGMIKALYLIVGEGFAISKDNLGTLMEYNMQW